MIYIPKNKTPEEILTLAGFERAPDWGWHKVYQWGKKRRWVPLRRLHAAVIQLTPMEIQLHYDRPDNKGGHSAFHHHPAVKQYIKIFQEYDEVPRQEIL